MAERVYFFRMLADADGDTEALLRTSRADRGVSLRWNVRQLPCFTLWKNETALPDGYVTGLEPGTNFPNPRSFEQQHDRVVRLAAGQTYAMQVGISLHTSPSDVEEAAERIRSLQGDAQPHLVDQPDPDWCAP